MRFQLPLQATDDRIVSNGPEDFLYGRYFFEAVANFAKAMVRTPTASVRSTSAITLPAKGALGSGPVVPDSTAYGHSQFPNRNTRPVKRLPPDTEEI